MEVSGGSAAQYENQKSLSSYFHLKVEIKHSNTRQQYVNGKLARNILRCEVYKPVMVAVRSKS
jgi:hypothetical protein